MKLFSGSNWNDSFYKSNKELNTILSEKYFPIIEYKTIVEQRINTINKIEEEANSEDSKWVYSDNEIIKLLPLYEKELVHYSNNSLEKNIKKKNLYKTIKKNLFSWRGYWSDRTLFYQENNVKEYMPRYFIGNNKQYMDKIFSFAKDKDKNIVGKAQNLLRELCTSEEMKKNLFEKENKIEDIISNDNLELRSYAFDILGSEFEKEEKDESKQNLLNNFFKNNINKIIDELEKFSKKEK